MLNKFNQYFKTFPQRKLEPESYPGKFQQTSEWEIILNYVNSSREQTKESFPIEITNL